jgi:hypothetical protein
MATRRRRTNDRATPSGEPAADPNPETTAPGLERRKTTSALTSRVARPAARSSRSRRKQLEEEAQAVGADIIPRGTISSDDAPVSEKKPPAGAEKPDANQGGGSFAARRRSAAPPAQDDTATTDRRPPTTDRRPPIIEPHAIRSHTIDQIEPVTEAPPDSLLSDWDLHLFNEGTHHLLWEKLGSHIVPGGVLFGVWAPNAKTVSVVGDFNG